MRCFIAIDIPEDVRAALADLQKELAGRVDIHKGDVKWTEPEGMHLTLKFLGEVPEAVIPRIADAVREIAADWGPFRIGVGGIGAFPSLRRPRVVWAGVHLGSAALIELAGAVEDALIALEFPQDERPFSAHLTLGRVKSPDDAGALPSLLRAHADDRFGEMTLTELVVFRSDLSPHGAQ